jgi:selenocysteine lyase/cysteine desulfurase
MLFVDAAQLAPHRPIDLSIGITALAFSAHKLYAPFGLGVLVLPKSLLDCVPSDPGGGSIDMISDHGIIWATPEFRHQTGTWNATGIVALGASCDVVRETGWRTILRHEEQLVEYMASALSNLPAVAMRVRQPKYRLDGRIGTFPFTLTGYHHALLSAVLEHEHGIEVRSGTICNHRLVRRWFEIDDSQQQSIEKQIAAGNRLASYGIVRASLGIHNTHKDADALATALHEISETGPRLHYRPVASEELYEPIFPS